MGIQRNLSVSTRPILPAALSPLSWRRHLARNLSTGLAIVLMLAALAAWSVPSGDPTSTSTALPLEPQPSPAPTAQATVDQQIESHITNQNGHSEASVTINGQTVTVPDNGTSSQTFTTPGNGQTTVTISNTHGSATNSSSTHTSITIENNQQEANP